MITDTQPSSSQSCARASLHVAESLSSSAQAHSNTRTEVCVEAKVSPHFDLSAASRASVMRTANREEFR